MNTLPKRLTSESTTSETDRWALQIYNTLREEAIITKMEDIDVLHSCLTPRRQKFPVIVREEYRLIWEYTSTAVADDVKHGHGGLVVYGQPGIGKSLFLRYALAHAIKAKIPVAWCANPQVCYFFDQHGAWLCDYMQAPDGCKLALFDTVHGMESPMASFYGPDTGVFVIQATSPKLARWKEWSKQADAEIWVMDLWNATEIDCMRKLKPTQENYYDSVAVSAYLGPSARDCAKDWKNSGDPTVDFARWAPPSFKNSDILYDVLEIGTIDDKEQHDRFHKYFFVAPNPTDERPFDASLDLDIRQIVPTDFLRNRIFDAYCSLNDQELKEMCRKFSPFPQICGAMFEVFAIRRSWLFQADLECHLPDGTAFRLPGGLSPTDTMLSNDTPAGTFWVAPPGYPTVDAAMVTSRSDGKKCVTFLQMTIAKKHGIKPQGIAKIWLNFEDVSDVEWRFIFVVPSEEIGKGLWQQLYPMGPRRKITPPPPNAHELKKIRLSPLKKINIPVGYTVAKFAKDQRDQWAKAFLWSGGDMKGDVDEGEPE